jgi:hypothetical protein
MSHKNIFDQINKEYSFLDDLEETRPIKPISQTKPAQNTPQKTYMNNYNIDETPQKFEMENNLEKKSDEYMRTAQGKFVTKPIKDEMTLDEAYQFLDVKKGATDDEIVRMVDKSNLENVKNNIKKAESKYYAFLNKEFNILNMKMIKCCIHCYDSHEVNYPNLALIC